jgi:hypothetical protein
MDFKNSFYEVRLNWVRFYKKFFWEYPSTTSICLFASTKMKRHLKTLIYQSNYP